MKMRLGEKESKSISHVNVKPIMKKINLDEEE